MSKEGEAAVSTSEGQGDESVPRVLNLSSVDTAEGSEFTIRVLVPKKRRVT